MTTTEAPTRVPKKIPTFNWVPLAFVLSLPVSAGIGWLLFWLVG